MTNPHPSPRKTAIAAKAGPRESFAAFSFPFSFC